VALVDDGQYKNCSANTSTLQAALENAPSQQQVTPSINLGAAPTLQYLH